MLARRWLAPGLAVTALALAGTGCGSGKSSSTGSGSQAAAGSQSNPGSPSPTSTTAVRSDGPKVAMPAEKIGILDVAAADPGAALLESSARQAAAKLGWTTVSIDAGGDPSKMAAGMKQLVAENVNAVLLDAVDPAAVADGLRQAASSKIPVVLYGGAGTVAPNVTQIVPNDFALASIASDYLINSLNGTGNVAIMTTDGITWSRNRSQLFEQIAKQYPGIHVVAVHQVDFANFTSDLLSATKAVLQAHPDLNAILATISPYPTPIAAALQQAGAANRVRVVGFYDYPSELKLIKAGLLAGVATASFPHNAWQAIDALAQFFGKRTPISSAGQYGLPLQYQLITRSNAPVSIDDDPAATQAADYYTRLWQSEFSNVR
jgi:ABC-type sugar transport system substrate-binding protein